MTEVENDTFDSSSKKFLFEYPEFYPPLFLYFQITSHAAMIRHSVFEQVGPFDETFKVFGDREWMLRFASAGHKALKVHRTVGLYLINSNGLEFSDPSGAREFVELRQHYTRANCLHKLFGRNGHVSPKESSKIYAEAGARGKNFYNGANGPVSDYGFAASLFGLALKLNPTNVIALNNLACIYMFAADWSTADSLLKAAESFSSNELRPAISKNKELHRRHCSNPDDFSWLRK